MGHSLRALALLALLIASFGRLSPAEATAAAAPAHAAMAGHCSDMPAPSPDQHQPMAIDCMIACAAVAPPSGAELSFAAPLAAMIEAAPPARIAGIHGATDPPPPRRS